MTLRRTLKNGKIRDVIFPLGITQHGKWYDGLEYRSKTLIYDGISNAKDLLKKWIVEWCKNNTFLYYLLHCGTPMRWWVTHKDDTLAWISVKISIIHQFVSVGWEF